ncbi:hypothetical protein [Streptomonospora litoralis]|uniref:XRE family transcriptional regulator n=1 Tax=Streptomonospora litoralis TaxID=2498135 RepID=A0A4P6Q0I3_9ACTN|nr:hypothetical protein [Streptomonospora litoralis]QBI53985.1 hypothetical protein EKD16_11000 [Streptomonospora litoralis]
MGSVHPLDCARRIRAAALTSSSDPQVRELHRIAEAIRSHCGHTPVKCHRLAWGWTVNQAISAARALAENHRDRYAAVAVSERSWKGWEAGDRPNTGYQDLLCRLFATGPVGLGFAVDYAPRPSPLPMQAEPPPEPLTEPRLRSDARTTLRRSQELADNALHHTQLDQIDADIDRIARDYAARPAAALYDEIRELRTSAFRMIESGSRPNQARRLHLAAARLGGLQAHICLDLGHYTWADTNARAAWNLADIAGHRGMLAWSRGLQSLIAYWDRRPHDALDAARSGLEYAGTDSNRSRLHALTARAAAEVGDHTTMLTAISGMEEARTHTAEADTPRGLFVFPAAKGHVYAATALLSADPTAHASRAREQAEQAIRVYTDHASLERSSGDLLAAHLDLATAHTAAGDLDALSAALAPVLATPTDRRTASILRRAALLASRLRNGLLRSAAEAHRLQADLTEFCRAPAALPATLPERQDEQP